MKFRMKMTICMVWLLALAYGIGSSALITNTFNDTLRREQEAAYRSYQMAVSTLQMVNAANPRSGADEIAAMLDQLSNQVAFGWSGLQLTDSQGVLYARGDEQPAVDLEGKSDRCV